MPSAPARPCSHAGCSQRQPCPTHKRKAYDIHRGSSSERGYNYRWQQYRNWFIRQAQCPVEGCRRNHVLCEGECRRQGRAVPAFAVDHITPHRGDERLFWDHANHRSLCESEHNAKAQTERLT